MMKSVEAIFKRSVSLNKTRVCFLSTAPQFKTEERLSSFRTTENDPLKHTSDHLGQFYRVDENDKKTLFSHGALPKSFVTQTKTFNETCLMIRRPALDIINCMKLMDYTKPVVRFVLYGKRGSGKSLSIAHIMHYALRNNFLIVNIPSVGKWMRSCKEYSNCEAKEGFIDINVDAAAWLAHFKSQNAHWLSNPDLKTTEDHVWNKRETTPAGSPLNDLLEHGINRIKYASICITILCNEIKKLSTQGLFKTLVAINGFNVFFHPTTRVYTEKKEMVHPSKVTVTEGFINLTKFDWNNGVVVLTVEQLKEHTSHFPKYLLGKEGFEHLDPFVPIPVPSYTNKELLSCMDYYRERKWVQPFDGQDEELSFVSGNNPFKLMNICAPL